LTKIQIINLLTYIYTDNKHNKTHVASGRNATTRGVEGKRWDCDMCTPSKLLS